MQADILINNSCYKIYEQINTGKTSGSVIYRAREATSLDFVAYKKLPLRSTAAKNSLAHQYRTIQELRHPNIIKCSLLSVDKQETFAYIFLELLQEYSLQSIIQKDHRLPTACASEFIADIRDALQFAHSKNILLNDIHPLNILTDSNGTAKIIEFENSCGFKQEVFTPEKIKMSTLKTGFAHRAPETLLSGGLYSTASDIYSLGCLFYFLLCGTFPFQELADSSTNEQEYATYLLKNEVEMLRTLNDSYDASIPKDIILLLFQMLQPVPFQRITWEQLLKTTCLPEPHQQFVIRDALQVDYLRVMQEWCVEGKFGEKYKKIKFTQAGQAIGNVQKEQVVMTKTKKLTQDIDNTEQKEKAEKTVEQLQVKLLANQQLLEESIANKLDIVQIHKFWFGQFFDLTKLSLQVSPLVRVKSKLEPPTVQQVVQCKNKQEQLNLIEALKFEEVKGQLVQLLDLLCDIVMNAKDDTDMQRAGLALCVLINKNSDDVINHLMVNKLTSLQNLFVTISTNNKFMKSFSSYALFSELLFCIIGLLLRGKSQQDISLQFGNDPVYFFETLLQQSDTKFTKSYSKATKDEVMFMLVQSKILFQFAINVCSSINKLNGNDLGKLQLHQLYTVVQNAAMNIQGDDLQVIAKRFELDPSLNDVALLSAQALNMLLSHSLSQYIPNSTVQFEQNLYQIYSSYHKALPYAINAYSLAYIKTAFKTINLDSNEFERGTQKQIDQSTYELLIAALMSAYKQKDTKIISALATLLGLLIISDQYIESILKNPLNVNNTSISRLVQGYKLVEHVDSIIGLTTTTQTEQLTKSTAFLISAIQIVLDVCSLACRLFSIQGSYLNTKYYMKCAPCLKLFQQMLESTFTNKYLLFTSRHLLAIEMTQTVIYNSIIEAKPEPSNQMYQLLNEELCGYFDVFFQVLQAYLQHPWAPPVRGMLMYTSNGKMKGIWCALISMLKIGSITLFENDKSAHGAAMKRLQEQILLTVPLLLYSSMQRYREAGPCGDTVTLRPQLFEKQDGAYVVRADVPEIGITKNERFSAEDVKTAVENVQMAVLRLVTSKTAVPSLIQSADSDSAFELLKFCYRQSGAAFTAENVDQFYELSCQLIAKGTQKLKKCAFELLAEMQNAPKIVLRSAQDRLVESAIASNHLKFAIRFLQQVKVALSLRLQGTQNELVAVISGDDAHSIFEQCTQIDNVFKEGLEKVATYVTSIQPGIQDQIQVYCDLAVVYCQVFMSNKVEPNVKTLATIIQQVQANAQKLPDRIIASVLDLIIAAQVYAIKNKIIDTTQFTKAFIEMKTDIIQQRLAILQQPPVVVKFPNNFFV